MKEKTLSEKREGMFEEYAVPADVQEVVLKQDKQFIKKILDEIKNKRIKLTYEWGDEENFRNFKRGYEKGFMECQELNKQIIKQKSGFEDLE